MVESVFRLAVALAIGLLVGLERGWRERDEPEGSRTAGLRTFGIFGLLGGLFAAVETALGSGVILAAGFLGFAALFGLFQYREAQQHETFSVTGVMAGLGVFALGALAVSGDYRVAAAGGAALAAILASRELLHSLLRNLSWVELRSAVMLAVMTTIVLPLLPNRTLDPYGGINPWQIWFLTVLIATISFLGYVAVRVLGAKRGMLLSALTGAIVSSTAVTVALARMSRSETDMRASAGAACLAAMVSLIRATLIVALLAPVTALAILPVNLSAALVFLLAGVLLMHGAVPADRPEDTLRNPFELGVLLLFAALFAAISFINAVLVAEIGTHSLLVSSAISGMFDVDVAVLSAVRLLPERITQPLVVGAIFSALGSNAIARAGLGVMVGPVKFWAPLLAATVAAVAAGVSVFALMSLT